MDRHKRLTAATSTIETLFRFHAVPTKLTIEAIGAGKTARLKLLSNVMGLGASAADE